MSMTDLPTEVLEEIFKHLPGTDLWMSRQVCQLWKSIVDRSEGIWKRACVKDFGQSCEESFSKARLSWAELHHSMSLWPKFKTHANVTIHEIFRKSDHFHILKNSIIAFPVERTPKPGNVPNNFDSVVYYDLQTLQECHREDFDFIFSFYEENNDIIAVLREDMTICVIPKANKKCYPIGRSSAVVFSSKHRFVLLENKVYFRNDDRQLVICTINQEEGEVTLQLVVQDGLIGEVIDVVRVSPHQVNMLTIFANIYSLIDDAFIPDEYINMNQTGDILGTLIRHGFKWTSPYVYEYLGNHYSPWAIKKFENTFICSEGNIVLLGAPKYESPGFYSSTQNLNCIIKFYHDGIDADSLPRLVRVPPISILAVCEEINMEGDLSLSQIDTVEIVNGHKIVLLVHFTVILVIECVYSENEVNEQREVKQKSIKRYRKYSM